MIIREFSPEWKLWIWSNIVNGYDRESVFNVLLNYGFDYQIIKNELGIEPTNALIWQRQYSQENLNQPHEISLMPLNKSICDNPKSYRIENNLIEIYHYPELLTLEECDDLISITDKKINKKDNIYKLDVKSELYKKVNTKILNVIGMADELGENIFIQKITPNFDYGERYDFSLPNQEDLLYDTKGHRAWSIQITLNNITEGGHLTFSSINRSIKPVKGDAVIWKNIYDTGAPNPYTKHTYLNTTEADKYVLFKYFRQSVDLKSVIEKSGSQEIELELNEIV